MVNIPTVSTRIVSLDLGTLLEGAVEDYHVLGASLISLKVTR
jgi:hypothetical protein